MKEEIERRRAEAAEKRQKVEDNVDGEDRPFKCVSPRGSSLKVSPFRLEGVGSQPPSWIGLRLTLLKGCQGDGTFNRIKSESRLRPRQHSPPALKIDGDFSASGENLISGS